MNHDLEKARVIAQTSLWVPADAEHKNLGWTYDFEQTERIARAAYDSTGYDAAMEVVEFVMSEADRRHATALAALTAGEEAGGNPVGEAGNMPGTDGFTMACFKAIDVPAGTKLYTHSTPSPIIDDAMVERMADWLSVEFMGQTFHKGTSREFVEQEARTALNAAQGGVKQTTWGAWERAHQEKERREK